MRGITLLLPLERRAIRVPAPLCTALDELAREFVSIEADRSELRRQSRRSVTAAIQLRLEELDARRVALALEIRKAAVVELRERERPLKQELRKCRRNAGRLEDDLAALTRKGSEGLSAAAISIARALTSAQASQVVSKNKS
jgi:hypothetical protein